MEKRREITIFTAILCLLVIYIHVTSEAVSLSDRASALFALTFVTNKLCTFVVPAFIFASSLKYFIGFSRNKPFSYLKFMRGRLTKVYLPYLLWVVIYYAFFLYRRYFPFSLADLGRYALYGDISSPFYFIVIIMQFYLLMPLWRLTGKIKNTVAMSAIFAGSALLAIFMVVYANGIIADLFGKPGFSIPYNDRIFTSYLPYWILGVFCGTRYDSVVGFLKKRGVFLLIPYAAIAALHVFLCYQGSRGRIFYRYAEQGQMLFNILSIGAVFYGCLKLADKAPVLFPFFRKLADASFYIYLSHCLVLVTSEYLLEQADVKSLTLRLIVKAAVVFSVPTALSIVYVSLKQNLKKKQPRITV